MYCVAYAGARLEHVRRMGEEDESRRGSGTPTASIGKHVCDPVIRRLPTILAGDNNSHHPWWSNETRNDADINSGKVDKNSL